MNRLRPGWLRTLHSQPFAMIRIDAIRLATKLMDMRAGTDTIGAHAAEVQVIELLAVRAQTACTRHAVPAAAIGQYHMIAYLQVLHLGAGRLNDASAFVAQDDRKWDGVVLIPYDHVRVAHAGRHDAHKDFIGYRGAQADGLDVEGAPLVLKTAALICIFSNGVTCAIRVRIIVDDGSE